MANDRRKLRLPGAVSWSTLSIALALTGAGCGGDDVGPADAATPMDAVVVDSAPPRDAPGPTPIDAREIFFCIYDSMLDSGGPFDAATCNTTVVDPEDCPGGCRAVG